MEAINGNNQFPSQNIHHKYGSVNKNTSKDRQFFAAQLQGQQLNPKRSKAVQVDHVEQQCVTRRNTFSGKNPLYIEETERPVFVNNYYAGDNPQHMFHEMGRKQSKNNDYSNFHLHQRQITSDKHDKASQSSDDWNMGMVRMHRMEEMQKPSEVYHPNQDPPVVVQPNKNHEFTLSSTKSYRVPDYSVPPPTTHAYKAPPDDSLLPGQMVQMSATTNNQGDQQTSLLETVVGEKGGPIFWPYLMMGEWPKPLCSISKSSSKY